MAFKQNNSPLQQGIFGSIAGQDWKSNYWENKRKTDIARGIAETKAELVRRQKPAAVVNTVDRAGVAIKPDPNAIIQPPQPPPPVDITPRVAVNNNSDYSLRNMTQKQQTQISPKAFSNYGTIQGMYGQAMPGTFNRSVGSPFMQTMDSMNNQPTDLNTNQNFSLPQPPPTGVETPVTPVYDINNY